MWLAHSECGRGRDQPEDKQGPGLMTRVHLADRMQHVVVPFAETGDSGGEGFVQKILWSV